MSSRSWNSVREWSRYICPYVVLSRLWSWDDPLLSSRSIVFIWSRCCSPTGLHFDSSLCSFVECRLFLSIYTIFGFHHCNDVCSLSLSLLVKTLRALWSTCTSLIKIAEFPSIRSFHELCFSKELVRKEVISVQICPLLIGFSFFCFYIVSSETASRPNKRLMRTYHWISLFMSYIKSAK
jgi:hypothetical protein